jgi:hypothetical protein
METRRSNLLMASGAAMDSMLWARAGSSGRRRQAKAQVGATRAVTLRAATPEAAAPSRLAEMAGHAKSWCQHQSWGLRVASRLCTSICGLTT